MKYWFNCKCGHIFDSSLSNINKGKWCPYCSNQKLCDKKNCNICYTKYFANHNQAKYWSDKNDIKPRNVLKNTHMKYWFKCECDHIFKSILSGINRGNWCPYCSEPSRLLCINEDCDKCFQKSFASHNQVIYWSNKNDINPRFVFKNSHLKYWFDCDCGHVFDSSLANINNNCWCSYCSDPPKQLCKVKSCQQCFQKSFASNEKSKYWSDKNKETPREICRRSGNKYLFNCEKGHQFSSSLDAIGAGHWCPKCINITEGMLSEWLQINYSTTIIHYQPKYDWCKSTTTDRYLPFDFELEEYKIIIELDGKQHFEQVSNWQSPEETVKKDIYKMEQAFSQGYTVIRLLQEDVFNNRNNWDKKLEEQIVQHSEPKQIFIGDVIYDNHRSNV